MEDAFLIVGIGAAAGGLRALREFFEHVPPDSDMAYVVILHLSPEYDSHIAEVLQRSTSLRVTQVASGVRVEPGRVYVIPPNQSLSMADGHLTLSPVPEVETRRAPIDVFFRTLADAQGPRAVSVVLSGTGADGSMGIKRVKERGGLCLAQDLAEAEHADMPRNSVATGLVDYVLPVAEIPGRIAAHDQIRRLGQTSSASAVPSAAEDLQSLDEELSTASQELKIKIEEQLRQSEARLRLILESVQDYAIVTTDTMGRIDTWNTGAARAFGYSAAEITGQPVDVLFTPEDRRAGVPELEMRQAAEEGCANDQRWVMRKDGSRFFVDGTLSPLLDGAGTLTGYVKIARDLTDRKRYEHLRRSQEDLEARVLERTRELASANVSLEAEVHERRSGEDRVRRLLRRLVTVQEDERRRIARDLHDHLGQQMTALRLNLEALKRSRQAGDDLTTLIENAERIATRLEADADFLAWELRPAGIDDFGLPATLGRFVGEWSKHYGIDGEFHASGLDRERLALDAEINLYRIAQEALNNVYKHANASRVDMILERRDNHVVLIIEDNGTGFDPAAAMRSGAERGLGLIGMRERAALAGGTLDVESGPGKGTTIFVRIPLGTGHP
jgi:PAS domain S-box-containing protein